MRARALPLVALIALAALGAAKAAPTMKAMVDIDPPFAIIHLTVEGATTQKLTFVMGNFSQYVDYAFAIGENKVCSFGRLEGDELRFNSSGGNLREVWIVLKAFKYEYYSAIISLPLPLVPLELPTINFSFVARNLPSSPNVISSPFNVSVGYNASLGYFISGSTVVGIPSIGNLTFSFSATDVRPAIKGVVRTIIVDSSQTTIIDNVTLVGVVNGGSNALTLVYPANFSIEGVGGLLGPYPPTLYTLTRTSNATTITVNLLAPPRSSSDVSYLWIKLSTPTLTRNGQYLIPTFISIGRYVQNLTVIVKARGELSGLGQARREDSLSVYKLPNRRVLGAEIDPYLALEGRLHPPQQPNYFLIAAVVGAFAALGYFAHARSSKESAATAFVEEVKVSSDLIAILKERESNLATFFDAWIRYHSGKLSRQAYRQAVYKFRRQEAELRKRARTSASAENAYKILDDFDKLFFEIDKLLDETEKVLDAVSKGFITEKERKARINDIKDEFRQVIDKINELIGKYS